MEAVVATQRQYFALKNAFTNIENAFNSFEGTPAVEILAFEIAQARNAMVELLGEYCPEEVLNRIFSSYCIGK